MMQDIKNNTVHQWLHVCTALSSYFSIIAFCLRNFQSLLLGVTCLCNAWTKRVQPHTQIRRRMWSLRLSLVHTRLSFTDLQPPRWLLSHLLIIVTGWMSHSLSKHQYFQFIHTTIAMYSYASLGIFSSICFFVVVINILITILLLLASQ